MRYSKLNFEYPLERFRKKRVRGRSYDSSVRLLVCSIVWAVLLLSFYYTIPLGTSKKAEVCFLAISSKNGLTRNMYILQVFFLQDLQDLAIKSCIYLASLALKMKLFLLDTKNLARILQEKIVR